MADASIITATAALWTSELKFYSKRRKTLCNGLYLDAGPGTLTAIMGLAGCGKSVFLQILAGYIQPQSGRVFLGEEDLHRNVHRLGGRAGYVPQAEIMIPELTVGTSLDYRLRFRESCMSAQERRTRCAEVCRQIGLKDVDSLLAKQIGAPEWRGNFPSGGERRRVNIAHELLGEPPVLLMDEPTTGLSSLDSDMLVRQMQRICRERQIPIVMTIHQPSQEAFSRIDDLLVIGLGGSPVYYGPCGMAAGYVEQMTNMPPSSGQNPADYVLGPLGNRQASDWMVDQFRINRDSGDFGYLKTARGQGASEQAT